MDARHNGVPQLHAASSVPAAVSMTTSSGDATAIVENESHIRTSATPRHILPATSKTPDLPTSSVSNTSAFRPVTSFAQCQTEQSEDSTAYVCTAKSAICYLQFATYNTFVYLYRLNNHVVSS